MKQHLFLTCVGFSLILGPVKCPSWSLATIQSVLLLSNLIDFNIKPLVANLEMPGPDERELPCRLRRFSAKQCFLGLRARTIGGDGENSHVLRLKEMLRSSSGDTIC